jgi:hypothetical protein
MNTATKSKYPVAIFELIPHSKNGANFVREDTIGTANPVVLNQPKNRVIMSESVIKVESKEEKGVFVNVPTRYVYNQEVILKSKQDDMGILPNPKTDKIIFINGLLTVPKDGAFVGLYNLLKTHAQNLTNPDRPVNLDGEPLFQPIFREIKPAEDANESNFDEFMIVEAVGYIKGLVTEKGGKYIYNEERIDALTSLFGVYGESVEQKTTALIAYAKADPQGFLVKAKANEQVMNIEVQHALKLGVISFEGNTVIYPGEIPEKIKSFGGREMSEAKKISALANYFSIVDGKDAYMVFKAKLLSAKEEALKQN